jgi:DNA-binding beta-propeller fold protein YncE
VQSIPLPGVEGRIDHLAIDAQRRRLFVAALGNDTVEVVDLNKGLRVQSIPGFHEPQGISFVSDNNRLFVANGKDGSFDILDGDSFRRIQSVKFADDADNVRYDSGAKHIYAGYGSGALGILDATDGRRLGDIKLAGHPESFQLEKSGARIFVNVPAAGHIAVVDRHKKALLSTWAVERARSNFPMALDEPDRRLLVGCRKPPRLLAYDTTTGKVVADLEICGDTDDLFYDPARKLIYVACGEGVLNIVQQKGADQYERLAGIPTAAGARTALFVPEMDRLYLAVPHRGDQRAEIRVYATKP